MVLTLDKDQQDQLDRIIENKRKLDELESQFTINPDGEAICPPHLTYEYVRLLENRIDTAQDDLDFLTDLVIALDKEARDKSTMIDDMVRNTLEMQEGE